MHHIGWGWWLLMSVGMVAFWTLLVYGLVWLVRGVAPRPRQDVPQETPKEILDRRLAAGEITVDEYERLRDALEEQPRQPIAA